jgi:adenylylsulfate kinase-like enzyme
LKKKGLYKMPTADEIPQFTGVSDPYKPPAAPEPHECARRVVGRLGELS